MIIDSYDITSEPIIKLENFYGEKQHLVKKCMVVFSTTLIISKKPGNTGISRDIRTEFTTDLLLSD